MLRAQDRELLARYALKTAIVYAQTSGSRTSTRGPIATPPGYAEALRERRLPDTLTVSLYAWDNDGQHVATAVAGDPELNVATVPPDQLIAFEATLGVDCLLLQVLGYSGPDYGPLQLPGVSDDYRIQLWPQSTSDAIFYPPRYALNNEAVRMLQSMGHETVLPQ
jgi:hypothetical protein